MHYKGPINATIIRRHQQWLDAAQVCSGTCCGCIALGPESGRVAWCAAPACGPLRSSDWCRAAASCSTAPQTRTARHKIAKFLRQHAALAVYKGMPPPSSTSSLPQGAGAAGADSDARQVRPGQQRGVQG